MKTCIKGKATRAFLPVSFILSALCLVLPVSAQPDNSIQRKKVAVVLEGGGAKGMAHIGVLRVLERAGIPVDIITGTSMGSIIGGLYAIGYDAATLDSLVREQDWSYLLGDKIEQYSPLLDNRKKQNTYMISKLATFDGWHMVNNTGGLIEGRNLERLFNELSATYPDSMNFNDLPIPFACVATNIMDNTEYDIHSGRLAEAMRASMSIPGVFAPIRKDDMVLVDGGLRNNYPVDVAKAMGADIVIGVTVDEEKKQPSELKSSLDILMQIISVNCRNKIDENLAMTDVRVKVDVSGYSMMSFTTDAIDTLIMRGEAAAMAHWDDFIALKQDIGVNADFVAQHPARTRVQENADDEDGEDDVALSETMKYNYLLGCIGVRFDTEEIVALQLNATLAPRSAPIIAETTLRLGKRIMWRTDFQYLPSDFGKMKASYIFRHNDMYIYNEGERQSSVMYNQHSVELTPLNFNIRNFSLDIGLRWEYYNFQNYLTSNISENMESSSRFFSYYAGVGYNSENDWYFPSRGARFDARYLYYTDDFVSYKGHTGFSELSASWRMTFPITNRLTLQPMAYGRLLFGSDIPQCRSNVIGGDVFSRYVEQQMPFAGVGHIEYSDKNLIALQLKASQRIAKNSYVQLTVTSGGEADKLDEIVSESLLFGTQIAYYYKSMFGPLGVSAGWSNRTDEVHLYLSLGFDF